MRTSFRVKYMRQGIHVLARVWVATSAYPEQTSATELTHASAGPLQMRAEEWEVFQTLLAAGQIAVGATVGVNVEFTEVTNTP